MLYSGVVALCTSKPELGNEKNGLLLDAVWCKEAYGGIAIAFSTIRCNLMLRQ